MIFIDTGAFYALVDRNDKNHQRAKTFYQKIAGKEIIATSIAVLVETWLLCEKYKIEKVFTFDKKHFSIYKPNFLKSLIILPE